MHMFAQLVDDGMLLHHTYLQAIFEFRHRAEIRVASEFPLPCTTHQFLAVDRDTCGERICMKATEQTGCYTQPVRLYTVAIKSVGGAVVSSATSLNFSRPHFMFTFNAMTAADDNFQTRGNSSTPPG